MSRIVSTLVCAALFSAAFAPAADAARVIERQGEENPVKEVAKSTLYGFLAGAALGGIAGSTVGGGHRANAAGAIAGAVVGGLIGNAVEKGNNDRRGVEVTVRLEGGRLIAITQEKDEEFRVGDRVRILSGQGATRVSRY